MTGRSAEGVPYRSSEDIYRYMYKWRKRSIENLWVVQLWGKPKRIIKKELVAFGTESRVVINHFKVFEKAMRQASSAIIIVHNHPSGNVQASESDIRLWLTFLTLSKEFKIPVIDFMIIGKYGYNSFADVFGDKYAIFEAQMEGADINRIWDKEKYPKLWAR